MNNKTFFESDLNAEEFLESSLSRIWQHLQSNKTFGVVSAFVLEYSEDENLKRHEQLRSRIKSLKLGYIEQNSGYSYTPYKDAPEDERIFVDEKSFFIPLITKNDIMKLGKDFLQESILFKDDNDFTLIFTDHRFGQVDMYFSREGENFTFDKQSIKYAYSALIKGHKNNIDIKFAYIAEKRIPSRSEAMKAGSKNESVSPLWEKTFIFDESSLSRLYSKMEKHDCATITAFRGMYTKKENLQRNRSLLAKILSKGYGATSVKGSYIEDFDTSKAKEVTEAVYFIEDMKDAESLKKNLINWGKEFDQDSVLFIPKGGLNAILIGTNNAKFPGLNKEVDFSSRSFGKAGEFMTKVKNRPFFFESIIEDIKSPDGYLGHMATKHIAKEAWRKMNI